MIESATLCIKKHCFFDGGYIEGTRRGPYSFGLHCKLPSQLVLRRPYKASLLSGKDNKGDDVVFRNRRFLSTEREPKAALSSNPDGCSPSERSLVLGDDLRPFSCRNTRKLQRSSESLLHDSGLAAPSVAGFGTFRLPFRRRLL